MKPNYKEKILTIEEALNFKPEDIAANEASFLSEAQRVRLKHQQEAQTFGIGVTGVVGIGLTLLLFALLMLPGVSIVNYVICIALLVGCFAIMMNAQTQRANTKQELEDGIVARAEGRIRLAWGGSKMMETHSVSIGDLRFQINRVQFSAFKNNDPYVLYFSPRTKLLLGAHHLTSQDYFDTHTTSA